MKYEQIQLEFTDNVAVLTLNKPEALNAISLKMLREILDAVERIEDPASGIRSFLLTGAGRAFSSGANLNDPDRRPATGEQISSGQLLDRWYNPLFFRLSELKIPFITAVNGAAAGISSSLALAGDMILAARSAYFLQAFRRIGLIPEGGATFVLPRLIGRVRAMELMLLGEKLPAEKALEWGMINRVCDDGELMKEAMSLARSLAQGPTRALGMMRKACLEGMTNSFTDQLCLERRYQTDLWRSEDFKEGVAAFKEKRPAVFKGK